MTSLEMEERLSLLSWAAGGWLVRPRATGIIELNRLTAPMVEDMNARDGGFARVPCSLR